MSFVWVLVSWCSVVSGLLLLFWVRVVVCVIGEFLLLIYIDVGLKLIWIDEKLFID